MLQKQAIFGNIIGGAVSRLGSMGSAAFSGIKNIGSSGLQAARNIGSHGLQSAKTLGNFGLQTARDIGTSAAMKASSGLQNIGSRVAYRAQTGRLNTAHAMGNKYVNLAEETYKKLRTNPLYAAQHGGNEQVIRNMAKDISAKIVGNWGKPRFGAWNLVDRFGTGISNIGDRFYNLGLRMQGITRV